MTFLFPRLKVYVFLLTRSRCTKTHFMSLYTTKNVIYNAFSPSHIWATISLRTNTLQPVVISRKKGSPAWPFTCHYSSAFGLMVPNEKTVEHKWQVETLNLLFMIPQPPQATCFPFPADQTDSFWKSETYKISRRKQSLFVIRIYY